MADEKKDCRPDEGTDERDEDEFERDLDKSFKGENHIGDENELFLAPDGDASKNDSSRRTGDLFELEDDIYDKAETFFETNIAAEEPVATKKKHRAGFVVLDVFLIILIALCVFLVTFNLMFTGIYVVGSSMSPTLTGAADERSGGGDYVYMNPRAEPDYGDIVVAYSEKLDENIIKRAIAFEGDEVEIVDGTDVYVNGELLVEDYVAPENNTGKEKSSYSYLHCVVGEGEIYLLGDNRDNSNDSRSLGCMKRGDVLGVVGGWALSLKSFTTGVYTFFNITLPGLFGLGLGWR